MPIFRRLGFGLVARIAAASPALAASAWPSPHLTIEKFAPWSEFLDVLNQPHINMVIRNDGTEAIASYGFRCRLFLLDRAKPIFEGAWPVNLDHVVRPGETQTVKLTPNMFSELGGVIQHHYDNGAWSCFVTQVLTASGQTIRFEPGQLPAEGPPFGVGYTPVPAAMSPMLNVPSGKGMWVLKVQPRSAAEVSGVKEGDVIVAIDGIELKALPDLPEALKAAKGAGRPARLSLIRAGRPLEIETGSSGGAASHQTVPRTSADVGQEGHGPW
jgi:hypothetical protein